MANTNPADAPYPLWSALGDYPAGYKVMENGEIYQSKWYNAGDKVLYLGLPYAAKWDNEGVSPLTGQGDPSASPAAS